MLGKEAKEIKLFPEVHSDVTSASHDQKRLSVQGSASTQNKRLSTVMISSGVIELDASIGKMPKLRNLDTQFNSKEILKGHGSPSLGLKKQMLAQQRLSDINNDRATANLTEIHKQDPVNQTLQGLAGTGGLAADEQTTRLTLPPQNARRQSEIG